MSKADEALLFACDEAACHEDPMFYEIFSMDDRWSIIRTILDAAVQSGKLARIDASPSEDSELRTASLSLD